MAILTIMGNIGFVLAIWSFIFLWHKLDTEEPGYNGTLSKTITFIGILCGESLFLNYWFFAFQYFQVSYEIPLLITQQLGSEKSIKEATTRRRWGYFVSGIIVTTGIINGLQFSFAYGNTVLGIVYICMQLSLILFEIIVLFFSLLKIRK